MLDYSKRKGIVDSFVSTLDFSKENYKNRESIHFGSLIIPGLPSASFESLSTVIDKIKGKMGDWESSLKGSRLGQAKKSSGAVYISNINSNIEDYCSYANISTCDCDGDLECRKYDIAYRVQTYILKLSDCMPLSCKDIVVDAGCAITKELRRISAVIEDRRYILIEIADRIVEESAKYRVNEELSSISNKGLSISDIEYATSQDLLDACCKYVGDKFGYGASSIVSAIYYAKKLGNAIPEMEWVHNDQVENIVKFAQYLGVKEFAFKGSCTTALSNLNILVKMGVKFRIEEITQKNIFNEESTYPVAIVML